MSVDITRFTESGAEEWNKYAERSPKALPFHRYEAIDLIAREVGATLHPLVGFKGQEPVGLLPLFETSQGPFQLVVSPPDMEIFSLGPALLNHEKLKQRKEERRHRRFVEASLDWIDRQIGPDHIDIRTGPQYTDLRPFIWRGYDVTPAYTYEVDISPDEEEILMSFSRDARSNIRDANESGVAIEQSGIEGIEPIIGRIRDRHLAQGESYSLTPAFVEALYEHLPDGTVRVYTVRTDAETIGGMVTLETGDTVYRWQGGAKTGGSFPANDSLDWGIIRDAKERGITRYDLVGANLPRLCRYKSKFNPTPVPYYTAKRRSSRMQTALSVYHLLPEKLRVV